MITLLNGTGCHFVKKILLIGKTGFIGSNLCNVLSRRYFIDCISYSNIDDVSTDYDVVINCCIQPEYRIQKYNEDIDFDLKVARKFKGQFVMFSSRKVYGNSDTLKTYNESSPVNPKENYSENKLITENKIIDSKDNYIIFRASNVFGFEPGRNSFLGFCIDQLINNNSIVFDLDHKVKRDFIYIKTLCDLVKASISEEVNGVYNLSSNIPYDIGNIARNLIIGYDNKSTFTCTGINNIKDQFVLDNFKLLTALKDVDINYDLDDIIQNLGKQICKI